MLEHGGRLRAAAQQYGIPLNEWLDLSTGLAPWPFEFPAVPANVWQRLPEAEDGLACVAAERYGAAQALPVAGAQAAIQLLPQLRSAGSRVGIAAPCYAEHAHAWQRAGHPLLELSDGEIEAVLDRLDVLLLVNPNNPTGRVFKPAQLLAWHARLAARGGWLVVDEAFIDATPELSLAAYSHTPGLIVLRSFGKFYGLARLPVVMASMIFCASALAAATCRSSSSASSLTAAGVSSPPAPAARTTCTMPTMRCTTANVDTAFFLHQ